MLRIQNFSFARIESKEAGVEPVRPVERRATFYEIRVLKQCRGHTRTENFGVGEIGERLHALFQVPPECVHVFRVGKTARHADDGDRLATLQVFRAHLLWGPYRFSPIYLPAVCNAFALVFCASRWEAIAETVGRWNSSTREIWHSNCFRKRLWSCTTRSE